MQDSARSTAIAREQQAGLVDSVFYLGATLIGRSAQLLAIPLLVRMLSPAEFGTFDLALVSVTLAATALLMGTDSGVAPEYARCDPDDLESIRGIFVSSCRVPLVLTVAVWAAMGLLQLSAIAPAALFHGAWLVSACALISSLLSCLVGLLRWTARAKRAAVLIAISGVIPLGGALLVAWATPRPTAMQMLVGLAAGYGLAAIIALAFSLDLLSGLRRVTPALGVIALLKRSWPMGAASLALPARRSAERLLILALLGESALASYAVLARLAQVVEIFLQALGNGPYPRALRLLGDSGGKLLAVRAIWLYWLASIAGVLAFSLAAPALLDLMGGAAFAGSPYLLPMATAVACLSALPFSAGMAYFHVRRIALYAGMLMLTGLVSLLVASAGAWITQSLAGWFAGMLMGSALLSFAYIRVSERLYPVGYRLGHVAAAITALMAIGLLPILLAG